MPLILYDFAKQEAEVSSNSGMPGLRIQYFRGPVWGKTNEQLKKQIVEGNNPITGKPVMQELVDKLTRPLTAEEKKTGEIKPTKGPLTFTGTPDELQQLFLEKRFTDFMPVVLPTEQKVAEMLKATSHSPDEMLGKMNPGSEAGETWTYTVKDAGYDTVEKFTGWVQPAPAGPLAGAPGGPGGRGGGLGGGAFTVVVAGGSNNNYWCMGGMAPIQSIQIDKWR